MGKATTVAVVGGGAGTVLIAAAQTKPEDAATNIAAWLRVMGVDQIPTVFAGSNIDAWATVVGALLLASAVWYLVSKRLRRPSPAGASPPPPVGAPFTPASPPPGSGGGVFLGGRGSKWIGGTVEGNYGHGILDMGQDNEFHGVAVRGNQATDDRIFPATVEAEHDLMPLEKAASEIFSEFHEELAEKRNGPPWDDPDKALGLSAQVLLGDDLIPLWGVRVPGTWLKRVPEADARSFQVSDDASELFDAINPKKRYIQVQIDKRDFERRRAELREELK